jgi:hypothetical protein
MALLMLLAGCSTIPPIPEVEIQERLVETRCVVQINPATGPELPAKPPYPGDDASDSTLKEWAVNLGEAVERREALLIARIAALLQQIGHHNSLEPRCAR